jgi:hypothetical protein
MVHVDAASGTAYLNAATVPRVRAGGAPGQTLHHFLVFELSPAGVEAARDVWVRVSRRQPAAAAAAAGGAPRRRGPAAGARGEGEGDDCEELAAEVAEEVEVLRTVWGENGLVRMAWDAHRRRWDSVVVAAADGGDGAAAAAAAAGAEARCAVAVCAPEE